MTFLLREGIAETMQAIIANYESDASSIASTEPDSVTTIADTISTLEDTQLVEIEPEITDAQPAAHQPVSPPTPVVPVNTEIDYLPPREGRRFIAQVPEPKAPKGA